jgi:hypothetical protein
LQPITQAEWQFAMDHSSEELADRLLEAGVDWRFHERLSVVSM